MSRLLVLHCHLGTRSTGIKRLALLGVMRDPGWLASGAISIRLRLLNSSDKGESAKETKKKKKNRMNLQRYTPKIVVTLRKPLYIILPLVIFHGYFLDLCHELGFLGSTFDAVMLDM